MNPISLNLGHLEKIEAIGPTAMTERIDPLAHILRVNLLNLEIWRYLRDRMKKNKPLPV